MGTIRQILPNYTVEDYERWEGQWELINGIAIAMSPSANPRHQLISTKLARYFDEAIENSACEKCKVFLPIDYKISDNSVVIPDLLIVCDEIKGQYLTFPPILIIEILSPSTALKDRNTKYDLYEREGVKYYVIIDPDSNSIEINQINKDSKYERVETNEFILNDKCKIDLDLQTLIDSID